MAADAVKEAGPPPYQILVISLSEERKRVLDAQFRALRCSVPVYFMPATTPANAGDYLPAGCDPHLAKQLCCSRSHIRAMAIAGKPSSAPFSVILEDDAALHKTQFFHAVEELIARWDSLVAPDRLVSLGWIPTSPLQSYVDAGSVGTLGCMFGSKILRDRYATGLQAYLVRKQDMHAYSWHLDFPTYEQMRDHVRTLGLEDVPPSDPVYYTDHFAVRAFGQRLVFPPVAIETDTVSTLEHGNAKYWDAFFRGREGARNDYMTYEC